METNAHEEAELNARFEAARQLYNACLDSAKRRLELLRQSKEYESARKMPKTVNGKRNKERTVSFKRLNGFDTASPDFDTLPSVATQSKPQPKPKFGFSEYDIHIYATTIRNSWIGNHLDSATAQKLATRAFKAVQKVALGIAKRVRFKGKNQLKSVEGKTNATGIRYKEKTGHVEWNGLKLKCIIDPNDTVVVHGLSHCVKFCRIVKRIFNGIASQGSQRFFVQLILEGKPFIKEKNKPANNTVGLDIGPSTIAYVSKAERLNLSADNAIIERFCDELKNKQKEIRRLQRKLDRQRRANNPQNLGLSAKRIETYNPDGTIKTGKKTWHYSTRLKITRRKLAELQRKLAADPSQAQDKTLHGNLADPSQAQDILRQGKHVKTEKLSYVVYEVNPSSEPFQKNYGRSVRDRAPGMFIEIIKRKAENAGGSVDELSTKTTKLSQYCHKCGKYTKKPLSQRVAVYEAEGCEPCEAINC